jgi:NADH:ubiquinone oxidoreductase subunit 3 (subunit A)
MKGAEFLFLPPVAFAIFLLVGLFLLWLGSKMAAIGHDYPGKLDQYACGEPFPATKVQPDYAMFFPFALFFTIIHVTALIMATLPAGNIALMGILYMTGIAISLYTLVVR